MIIKSNVKLQQTIHFSPKYFFHFMTSINLVPFFRYSYRNKELESVRNIRLTYKFGPNMKFKAKNLSKTNSVRYQREA